jgi:biopolymer transport protein ExbB
MIKAFSALSAAGTQIKLLANGISEALINCNRYSTSALAIVAYNFFTSKIDTLTYSIEAGNTIVNTYRHFRSAQNN